MQNISNSSKQISAEHKKLIKLGRIAKNSALVGVASGLTVVPFGLVVKDLDNSIQEQCLNNRNIACEISKKLPSNPFQTGYTMSIAGITIPACSIALISLLIPMTKDIGREQDRYEQICSQILETVSQDRSQENLKLPKDILKFKISLDDKNKITLGEVMESLENFAEKKLDKDSETKIQFHQALNLIKLRSNLRVYPLLHKQELFREKQL